MEDTIRYKKKIIKKKKTAFCIIGPFKVTVWLYVRACVYVCAWDSARCEDNQHPIILMIACLHFIQICVHEKAGEINIPKS